jgi:RHS repeat-associated protein
MQHSRMCNRLASLWNTTRGRNQSSVKRHFQTNPAALESLEERILLTGDRSLASFALYAHDWTALQKTVIVRDGLTGGDGWVKADVGSQMAGVEAGGTVTALKNVVIDGSVLANGDVQLHNDARVGGDVDAGATAKLLPNASIAGDLTAAGAVHLDPGATVGGTIRSFSQPDVFVPIPLPTPTQFETDPANDVLSGVCQIITLAPGRYGDLRPDSYSTLNLSTGTYTFDRIVSGIGLKLNLDVRNGPIEILVAGNVDWQKELDANVIGGTARDVYLETRGSVRLFQDSEWFGTIYALGPIAFYNHTRVSGAAFSGKSINTFQDSIVTNVPARRFLGDLDPPQIAAALAHDTGLSPTDRVTSDPAVAGTVVDAQSAVASLEATLDPAGPGDPTFDVEFAPAGGSFQLSLADLEAGLGRPLLDGVHTLRLRAADTRGNASAPFDLTFTLDTTPPGITLDLSPGSDSDPAGDNETDHDEVTLEGVTESELPVQLFRPTQPGPIANTVADAAGRYTVGDLDLQVGDNPFTASATDRAGNIGSVTETFVRTSSSVVTLVEGNHFTVSHVQPIAIPSQPATLEVSYEGLVFDQSANFVNDAFEAALLGSDGTSLVHTIQPAHTARRDAFFNVTEDESPLTGANTQVLPGRIRLDLSHIAAGTDATLVLRLVNNDSDTTTTVTITDISIVPGGLGTPVGVAPGADLRSAGPVDFHLLSDVSSSIEPRYGVTSFADDTERLTSVVSLHNGGTFMVRGPLVVALDHISDPTVEMVGADGQTPDGRPYFDFSALVSGNSLSPGESTGSRSLAFFNPNRVQFTFELVAYAQLNHAPELTTQPVIEALADESYRYDADATDADGDAVAYSLTMGPSDMSIDPQTGELEWSPGAEDVGTHAVSVRADDGNGGVDDQAFVVEVSDTSPNRPPRIVSTPVTTGAVNTEYAYHVVALDPDRDTLAFGLRDGPAGMSVDAATGVVHWVPTADQLGDHAVTVQVSDGRGGVATQSYDARVAVEPGNHPPVIISDPVTMFNLPGASHAAEGNVNPNVIHLELEPGQVASQSVAVTLAQSGQAYADIVFLVDESESMDPEQAWIEDMVLDLEDALEAEGIGPNRYFVIGFGGDGQHEEPHFHNLNIDSSIFLYAPDDQLEASRALESILPPTLLDATLPADGEYVLVMAGNQAGDPITYGFRAVSPSVENASLTLGDVTEGTLDVPGDVDNWTFTLGSPSNLYFDSLISMKRLVWSLTGPSGTVVDAQPFWPFLNGTASFSDRPVFGLPAGQYTLSVASPDGDTGVYRFRLSDLAAVEALDLGNSVRDSLEPHDEAKLYRFTTTAPDEYFFFDMTDHATTVPGEFDPNSRWVLLDPYGRAMFSVQMQSQVTRPLGLDNSDVDTLRLAQPGSYVLAMEGATLARGHSDYEFTVQPVQLVTRPLILDDTTSGAIGVVGESDIFSFSLAADTNVTFDSLTNDSLMTWRLDGPAGTYVSSRGFHASDASTSLDEILKLDSGNYTLRVDANGDHIGSYAFRLRQIASATPIPTGTVVNGLLSPPNETDLFQFDAIAGSAAFFDFRSSSGSAGKLWRLVDPTGTTIFTKSFASNSQSDVEPVTFALDGHYTLLLEGAANATVDGPYSFLVQPVSVVSTPLVLGDDVAGAISVSGEQDEYRFTLLQAASLYFDSLTNDNQITWSLVGPAGVAVSARPMANSDATVLDPILPLVAGDYVLTVDGTGDHAGPYQFRIYDFASATALLPGTAVSGQLSPASETDLYYFTAAAGDRFSFDSQGGTATNSTRWRLFDRFGTRYFTNTFTTDIATLTLPQSGNYTLAIEGPVSGSGSATYTFNVLPQGNVPPTPVVGVSLVLGQLTAGAVSVSGEKDVYTFALPSDSHLYFDSQTNNLNLRWTLVGPAGTAVNARQFSRSDAGDETGDSVFRLPAGDYALTVDGSGTSTGSYQFKLHDLAASPALTPGTPVAAELNPANETDLYQFTAAAGDRFYFDQEHVGNNGGRWRLIDPFGTDLFIVGFNADVDTLQLMQPGTYKVLVEGRVFSTAAFPYTINVQPASFTTQPLVLGSTVAGSIGVAGEQDAYSFHLAQRSSLYFDALSNLANVTWTLRGPGGTEVSARKFSQSDGANVLDPILDVVAGDYTLTVDGVDAATGAYSFRLWDMVDAQSIVPGAVVGGTLDPAKETDLYRFNATTGQRLYFDLRAVSGSTTARARLVDRYGNVLFSSGLSNPAAGDVDSFTVTLSGTYSLLLEGFIGELATTSYSFVMQPADTQVAPLSLGALISSSIGVPGESDAYAFSLADSAWIYFDSMLNDNRFTWQLNGPSGLVASNQWFNNTEGLITPGFGHGMGLPAGAYTFTVDAAGDLTGSYAFRLWDVDGGAAIAPGTPVSGTLAPGNETDLYRFDASAGEELFFDAQARSGLTNARWMLVDAYGNVLFNSSLGQDVDTIKFDLSGTYALLIQGGITDTAAGSYTVNVQPAPTSVQPLALGQLVGSTIGVTGETDEYLFTLPQATRLYFDSQTFDTRISWKIERGGETVIAGGRFDNSDGQSTGQPVLHLGPGDYSLIVDATGDATGPYAFRLSDLSAVPSIASGELLSGSLVPGNETDLYRFNAIAGDRFYFDSLQWTGPATTRWRLIDPEDHILLNVGLSTDVDTLTLPITGEYVLALEGSIVSTTSGNYSAVLQKVQPNVTGLSFGTTIGGSIGGAGDEDNYTFSLADRSLVYFDGLTNNSNLTWSLRGPAGVVVDKRSFVTADPNFFTELVLNLAAGDYTVTVDATAEATGLYEFRFWDLELATPMQTNVPVVGSLIPASESDVYRFTAVAGDQFKFDLGARSGAPNARWRLVGPAGKVFFTNRFDADVNSVTVDQSGEYSLLIEGAARDTANGSYDFTLQFLGNTPPAPINGTPLALDTLVSASIGAAGEQDNFTFTLAADANLYFDSLTNSSSIKWSLTGPAGSVVTDRRFDLSNAFDISPALISLLPGPYVLTVSGVGSATGAYQFVLRDPKSSPIVAVGSVVSGSLNPARETDLYRFNAHAGDRVYFDMRTALISLTNWRVMDTFGNELLKGFFGQDLGPIALQQTGDYTLVLEGATNTVASYVFAVLPQVALELGQTTQGSISQGLAHQEYWFDGTVGQRVYYDSLLGTNSVEVRLITPSGTALFTNITANNRAPVTLPESGKYRLAFDGATASATGAFQFRLVDVASAPALQLDESTTGVLDPAVESDLYRLSGTPGQRVILVPTGVMSGGTAVQASLASTELRAGGIFEDGYAAIDFAVDQNPFRPGAAVNFLLISDEDRDSFDFDLTFADVFSELDSKHILLNLVNNVQLKDGAGAIALAVDDHGVAYKVDGAGGFTTSPGGTFVSGFGTTKADYVDMAWALGGALFDLNQLERGGLIATSFTKAFVDFKTEEIRSQLGIDLIASDSTAPFVNRTGVVTGVAGGQTVSFDAEFTGDGLAHSFDLQFVRADSGVLLGSIPVTINTAYRYPVRALDADGDAITYRLLQAPQGAAIDPSTGRIHWEPPGPGQFEFLVQADDGRGGQDVQRYVVDVTAGHPNDAPVITSTPPVEATEGLPFAYSVTAQDSDGDRLVYFLTHAPAGMAIDRDTGLVTWLPADTQLGTHSVTARVQDGHGGFADQSFEITVVADADNRAPAFATAPITAIVEGQTYLYAARASDANSDALTYDLVVHRAGMAVDAQTGMVAWRPGTDDVGVHDVFLRVRDGRGGVALQNYRITVVPLNSTPVITSQPGSPAAVGRPYRYEFRAQDAELDALVYAVDGGPSGLVIDSQTGEVSWTPTFAQLGTHSVVLSATDSLGHKAIQAFSLTVVDIVTNAAPIITSIPRNRIALGSVYFYAIQASDPNHDPLAISLETAPAGMAMNDARVIVWTPTAAQFGSNLVELVVEDGRGGVARQSFAIEVTSQDSNQPPTITSTPRTTATVDRLYSYNPTGLDPDGDPLVWSLIQAPQGMSIDGRSGRIRWRPTVLQVASHVVELQAFDLQGGVERQRFTIDVRAMNLPPLIGSVPPIDAFTNQLYTHVVEANDPDGDSLSYSLIAAPQGMAIDPQSGRIDWIPLSPGVAHATVQVDDGQGGVATEEFILIVHVTGINRAPRISSRPRMRTNAGQLYEYQLVATDPELQAVTYSFGEELSDFEVAHPVGMVLDRTTGLLRWIPTPQQVGDHAVTLVASDPGGSVGIQIFEIRVYPSDTALTIVSLPVTQVTAGQTYRYDVRADDANGSLITYALVTAPDGMQIDGAGRITWETDVNDLGTYPIRVAVSNDRGLTVTQDYALTVSADVLAPHVSVSVNSNPAALGSDVVVRVTATDNVRVAAVTLIVGGVPVGLDDRGRATVTMTTAGTVAIVAEARDETGNVSQATRTLEVIDTSDADAPVVRLDAALRNATITSPMDVIGTVLDDNLLFYKLEVATVDGGSFHEIFRGTQSVDDGVLGRLDPTILSNDSYLLRLTARDAGGNESRAQTTVHVTGNVKPGEFSLSFIDLAIALSGVPLAIVRTYDTLESTQAAELGFGWKMEFLNVNARTSVPRTFSEEVGDFNAFEDGTHVYLTLPEGTRQGFTFRPQISENIFRSTYGFVDFIYEAHFEPDPGVTSTLEVNEVYLVRNNGKYFVYGPSGAPYNASDPMHGGTYFLTTKFGLQYQIDAVTSRIEQMTSPNGATIDVTSSGLFSNDGVNVLFDRDAAGRIVRVIDPAGRGVGYAYDGAGDLVAVTNREGFTTTLKYDSSFPHYLTDVIDPLGRSGFHTEYDAAGRLVRKFDGTGHPTSFEHLIDQNLERLFDANGNPTTYRYDNRGNIIEAIDAIGGRTEYTVDGDDNVTSATDPLGHTITMSYDDRGNLLGATDALGRTMHHAYNADSNETLIVDPMGNVTSFDYDAAGKAVRRTDALGNTVELSYQGSHAVGARYPDGGVVTGQLDAAGNISRRFNQDGTIVDMTWDANKHRLSDTVYRTIDGTLTPMTTRYVYDRNGNLTETIWADDTPGNAADNPRQRIEYDVLGQVSATIDELGRRTRFEYDLNGRRTSVTYADGSSMRWEYDLQGNLVATIDQSGRTTRFAYDALNRLVRAIGPDDTPGDPTDNPTTEVVYDAAGHVSAQIDARGYRTDYEYDVAGQLKRMLLPETMDASTGTPRRATYSYAYDARGLLVSLTDPAGGVIRYELDALGQPTRATGPDGSITQTSYDERGRISSRTDPLGHTTTYEYDLRGNLVSVTSPPPTATSDAPVYHYDYDEAGLLTNVTDALGHVTRSEYDIRGRLAKQALPGGQVSSFEYDAKSRVVSRTDYNGQTTAMEYDALDRVIRERFDDGVEHRFAYTPTGKLASVTTPAGVETYEYDVMDRLTEAHDIFGEAIEYDYDLAGNRTELTTRAGTTRYTYDELNRLDLVIAPAGGTTSYGYDIMGNLVRTEMPNGVVETRAYDSAYRLLFLGQQDGDGNVIESFTYTVDALARRTSVTEASGRSVSYIYDGLGRLVLESISDPAASNHTIAYSYDLVGNRLSRNDSDAGITTYQYDANDRLLSEATGGSSIDYSYDDNGAVVERRTSTGEVTDYTWDARDRLVRVDVSTPSDAQTVQYTYAADGLMTSRSSGGTEIRYLVDRNRPFAQVLEERTAGGVTVASYIYGLDLISQTRGGSTAFYHTDGLGSTRALTDGAGQVTDRYVYDAYGRIIQKVGGTVNDHLFVGESRDAVTGLDYLRLRHLDPSTGRFLSQDSAAGALMTPMTLHRYMYVNDNPVNLIDPSGAETLIDVMVSNAITGINAALSVFSKLSFICRFESTMKLVQEGLQIASFASFVSFSVTDWLARQNPLTADDRNNGLRDAGLQLKYEAWEPAKGALEKITFKLGPDLTGDVKFELAIGFKDEGEGSIAATISPFDKFFNTLQLSVGKGIELCPLKVCGIQVGKIELAPKFGSLPVNGQYVLEVALKASDSAGLFEITFNILKAFSPPRPSVQIGGYTVYRT